MKDPNEEYQDLLDDIIEDWEEDGPLPTKDDAMEGWVQLDLEFDEDLTDDGFDG